MIYQGIHLYLRVMKRILRMFREVRLEIYVGHFKSVRHKRHVSYILSIEDSVTKQQDVGC